MLTAKSEEIDKVVGLKLGADDYITKPFGIHELLARISAVLRRSMRSKKGSSSEGVSNFRLGETTVDTLKFELERDGETTELTEREVKILKLFHDHPNEVLKRDFLLNEIWGINYYGTTRTLDQHIAQLRKKIEGNPSEPTTITTVHGVGYRYII